MLVDSLIIEKIFPSIKMKEFYTTLRPPMFYGLNKQKENTVSPFWGNGLNPEPVMSLVFRQWEYR